jgi:hypothetical protein
MRLADFNIIKTNREIEAIKLQLDQLLVCLSDREKTILDAIAEGRQNDERTADIIEKQEQAISKLEDLNAEKAKTLSGMTKWIILAVLGVMSLTVRYNIQYSQGEGVVITPHPNPGPVLPTAYALAIIAIATGQDAKVGVLIEGLGKKIGG